MKIIVRIKLENWSSGTILKVNATVDEYLDYDRPREDLRLWNIDFPCKVGDQVRLEIPQQETHQ